MNPPLAGESFRSLATIIIPGAMLTGPYVLWALHSHDGMRTFAKNYENTSLILAFLVIVAAGMVLEDLGSWLETRWDKKEENDPKFDEAWWKYLRTAFSVEPIGQGHLRKVLLFMNFELSTSLALFFSLPGVLACAAFITSITWGMGLAWALIALVIGCYLIKEAKDSWKLLGDMRSNLLKGVLVQPGRAGETGD